MCCCCCGGGHHLSPPSSMSPSSSLLSKLRLVTVDVTGTLIAYKGQLGDYYCMAAKSAGMPCPDYKRVHEGFKLAYADMSRRHPCFGHAAAMPTAQWWKMCVRDSFARVSHPRDHQVFAGYEYDDDTFERIFRRIYATFGSSAPYSVFPDAHGFLRWLRGRGLLVGVVSNAEHRYRDVVLPALGLNQVSHPPMLSPPLPFFAMFSSSDKWQSYVWSATELKGSEWDFGVFSGVVGVEKPDTRIYEAAMEAAGGVAAGEALHIGDSLRKDYAPARSLGMHALLLDRFGTEEAGRWRRSGVPVLPDLVVAKEWLVAGAGEEAAEEPGAWHTSRIREVETKKAAMLRLRACAPPALVPALVRARLARRASSAAAYAAAATTVAASSSASSPPPFLFRQSICAIPFSRSSCVVLLSSGAADFMELKYLELEAVWQEAAVATAGASCA
ncbi:hypothetical protein HU200_040328 [Digitaria exilis]|uniref:Haloacid dehalogenase-like hydrolase domain-containing protein 3 n=1 Tax=Digitaria exilis TaxID=1010633 RepID=A0A835EJW9_9POAL|nr:hypothetical protein HU200_040328 [Digitaria exilis]